MEGVLYTQLDQRGPEVTSKLHEEMAQLLIPVTLPSLSHFVPVAS